MGNLTKLQGAMPSVFAGRADLPNMTAAAQANLQPSFAVVGYKGSKWHLKYRGEDEVLIDAKRVPIPTLEVVIVGISPSISKLWYEKKYSDGDDVAPDCFSVNGVVPDAASPKKQCATCAVCPQNIWGSRVTDNGKKAKACQDSRRIAIVPLGDIDNEGYGGPMLLRVPPMSLANLAKYGTELERFGAQPFMVATQLGFNYDVAYPLIEFTALGWLDEQKAGQVAETLTNPAIERMLETATVEATADTEGTASALAGGAPAPAFQAPAAQQQPAQSIQPAQQEQPARRASAFQTVQPPADQPVAQVQPAQPSKASAFQTQPAEPAQQVAAETPKPKRAAPVVVAQAPADMDAAIDDLLSS